MKTRDLIKLSTRMFVARRGRTALTILGMGIGFGAILFLVSLGYGLQNALLETITSSGALTTLDVTASNEEGGSVLSESETKEMKTIDGVANVEPGYDFNARLKIEETATDARVVIGSPAYLGLEGIKVAEGEKIDTGKSKLIIASSAFGKILGKSPEELVGQKVSFSILLPDQNNAASTAEASGFEIAGVMESEETIFYANIEDVAVPKEIPYSKLKVQCGSSETMDSVKEKISAKGFSVSSLSETVVEVNKLFRMINFVLGLFGIVTLIVSAIGMFNTMTVALLERTREIGIMRSIGASRIDILMMFLIESSLMGISGGAIGIVLGVASGQFVNFAINTLARYFGGRAIDLFSYPLWFLGFIFLFSIIIGITTGIGPAKRASSLDPLDALRTR